MAFPRHDLEGARARYRDDVTFRLLVDNIAHWYERQHATPSEVRSAAMLAAWMVEERTLEARFLDPEGGAIRDKL